MSLFFLEKRTAKRFRKETAKKETAKKETAKKETAKKETAKKETSNPTGWGAGQPGFPYFNNKFSNFLEKYIELSFGNNDGKLLIAIIST